ncbi:glycine cleavage system aminomethyltransferase GcvT [Paracoccus pacificus]|uniref:aminomethyltransferase n=1 Tax=Paracoccus pacificus TaxID=1463598 RepID=A0ABW4RCB5_9RHOB
MVALRQTPLHDLHAARGARMVPFAGWEMPVQYPMGVLAEHMHCRSHAGLFDVSHMGQVILRPRSGDPADAAAALETLVPADIAGLAPGRQRYGLFTSDDGGILDDLMITNRGDHLLLVVNAACTDQDLRHLEKIGDRVAITHLTDRGLLALQGPEAEAALARLLPGVAEMRFMDVRDFDWNGATLWVSRSGYTGEDGFEISVPAAVAEPFARALLDMAEVAPIGLGARDSLRLEAGLPLYGHDMDQNTSPAQAALGWSIPKLRRQGGARAGGFPGAGVILPELADGPAMMRRGLRPQGRAPIREGVEIFDAETGGESLSRVGSGGFGPDVGAPIAMAPIPVRIADGATVWAELRGKRVPVTVAPLPFRPSTYKR